MSTPQGPDGYGADRDPDQAGPPTWGAPPPGGWGEHPDAGPPTGAWDPATDEHGDPGYGEPGYGGRRRADDREGGWDAPPDAPWGDRVGYADERAFGAGRPGGRDPWSDTGETTAVAWGADPEEDRGVVPGDEPWAPRDAARRPRRGPFGLGTGALAGIGAGVVVLVVLAVLLFVAPGWAVTRTLDKTALQNGVTQILTQNYKLQVGAVECPDDVVVEADTGFACQALVDGEPVTVPGKVTSDEGDYQVSRV